jgi:hypothetical protein
MNVVQAANDREMLRPNIYQNLWEAICTAHTYEMFLIFLR